MHTSTIRRNTMNISAMITIIDNLLSVVVLSFALLSQFQVRLHPLDSECIKTKKDKANERESSREEGKIKTLN